MIQFYYMASVPQFCFLQHRCVKLLATWMQPTTSSSIASLRLNSDLGAISNKSENRVDSCWIWKCFSWHLLEYNGEKAKENYITIQQKQRQFDFSLYTAVQLHFNHLSDFSIGSQNIS